MIRVSKREVLLSIYGAFRFAKFDSTASKYFANTQESFWISFYASLVALPTYATLVLLKFTEQPVEAGSFRILAVETSAYVIGWTIFPLIMIYVTSKLGRFSKYFQFIAAWNWAIVLQVFLFLFVRTLVASGAVPPHVTGFVILVSVIAILIYQSFIASTMLDIRAPIAVMIVTIDFFVALALNVIVQSLYSGYSGI